MSKRKSDGKDNRSLKKGLGVPAVDKQPKQSLPPKPSHGAGKGLMMATGPVTQGTVRHLLTHKEHVVEMVKSINKETNLDPCAEEMRKDQGASGLFDLVKVRFSHTLFHFVFSSLADGCFFISGVSVHEGFPGQVCHWIKSDLLAPKASEHSKQRDGSVQGGRSHP